MQMRAVPTLTKKIFFLAFLNLCLLALLLLIFASVEFRFQADSLLMIPAEGRISAAKAALSAELEQSPAQQRDAILAAYSKSYGVQFILVDSQANQLGGAPVFLPEQVRDRITHPEPPGGERGRPPPPPQPPGDGPGDDRPGYNHGPPRGPPPRLPGNPPLFLVTSHHPTLYWVGQRMAIPSANDPHIIPGVLLLISPSLLGNSFFFDVKPWLALIFGVVALSVACWLPFIRGITGSVRSMSEATAQLAEGRFDVQLPQNRADELGQLSASINRMAAQLQGFIKGQKRFLGDTAHELCAPIARLQFALGILDQVDPAKHRHLADLQEEVQHMSGLVNELLSFSKASIQDGGSKMVRVNLAEVVDRVLAREKPDEGQVEVQVYRDLDVHADPDCVFRSLSNLVRNAMRYAGDAGPITITAEKHSEQIQINVADCGPGLPEDALEDIFKPFYRPERARTRESGGTGLGLAIVKTCIESCQGSVIARNRKPSGLVVEIRLPVALKLHPPQSPPSPTPSGGQRPSTSPLANKG